MSVVSIRLAHIKHGDPLFIELLRRLLCQQCRKPPAPVYLLASHHRTRYGGPSAYWAQSPHRLRNGQVGERKVDGVPAQD